MAKIEELGIQNILTTPPIDVGLPPGITLRRMNDPEISGLSVDYLEFEPDSKIPNHTHSSDHSIFVKMGEGRVWREDKGWSEIHRGDCLDVVGLVMHSIGTAKGKPLGVLSITSPPAPLKVAERMVFANGLYKPGE
jgi:quercetin dioxygenase-like cupin family protein